MSVSVLHQYIRWRSYADARARLHHVPNEATSRNTPKQLPLHVAAKHLFDFDRHAHRWDDDLVDLIYDLLEVCPAAVGVRDSRGDTVLLIACKAFGRRFFSQHHDVREQDLPEETQIQLDVLSSIIDAYPAAASMNDAEQNGKPPLQILLQSSSGSYIPMSIVQELMRIYPQAIMEGVTPHECGNPLIEYCMFEETLPRLHAIVEIYPEAAMVQSTYDNRPTPLAKYVWEYCCRDFWGPRTYETDFWSTFGLREHQLDEILSDVEDRWGAFIRSILFLLKAAYHGTTGDLPTNGRVFRALHAACALKNLPLDLIHFLTKRFPRQLMERDEQGRLPLHIAAASTDRKDKRRVLQLLTRLNPGAAATLDSQRRLPLHLALANGDLWVDGVSSLVQTAPMALLTRDPSMQLYPALMAAATCNEDVRFHQERDLMDVREEATRELREQNPQYLHDYSLMLRIDQEAFNRARYGGHLALETIFELLRADPSIVRRGIPE